MYSKQLSILFCLLLSAIGSGLLAQAVDVDSPSAVQPRELGLRFSGFDDFNVFYKKHLDAAKVARHRFLQTRIDYNKNSKDWDMSFGYAYGRENYKPISQDFNLYHGLEGSFFFDYSNSEGSIDRNTSLRLVPAISYVIGVQIEFSERFNLSLEVLPALVGSMTYREGELSTYQVGLGFNSNSTALSLMYRFVPNK